MEQDRVIALGFFDGVHRGHQAILNKAAELARQGGLEVAAVTFETHPRAYVRGRAPDLVCSFARRCALLQQTGAGLVVAQPFDRDMAEPLPEDTSLSGAAGAQRVEDNGIPISQFLPPQKA